MLEALRFFGEAVVNARTECDFFYPASRWERSWVGCCWFVLSNWKWLRKEYAKNED